MPASNPLDRSAASREVTANWLAAMIRNYVEDDDVLHENGAVVIQPPGDDRTILVLQRGGNHLIIQVGAAELVISP